MVSPRSLEAGADAVRAELRALGTRLRQLGADAVRVAISHFPAYWMTGGRVVELAPTPASPSP